MVIQLLNNSKCNEDHQNIRKYVCQSFFYLIAIIYCCNYRITWKIFCSIIRIVLVQFLIGTSHMGNIRTSVSVFRINIYTYTRMYPVRLFFTKQIHLFLVKNGLQTFLLYPRCSPRCKIYLHSSFAFYLRKTIQSALPIGCVPLVTYIYRRSCCLQSSQKDPYVSSSLKATCQYDVQQNYHPVGLLWLFCSSRYVARSLVIEE